MTKKLILFSLLFCFLSVNAYAYIDPGSGGYFITSVLAAIGGFFAIASAVVIHFFRHTVLKFFKLVWHRFRLATLVGLGAVVVIGAFFAVRVAHRHFAPQPQPNVLLSGAHFYDPAAVYDGYNLFNGKLIDMQGMVVRRWKSTSLGVLDTNGDYYAQRSYDAPVWGRYSWDDKMIWEKNLSIHHEIVLTPQGTVMAFTKEIHEYQGRKNVEFDVVLEFDKNGNQLQRYSFWDHLTDFRRFHGKLDLDVPPMPLVPESPKPTSVWGGNYDYYHLNSLSFVPPNNRQKTDPAFRPGNWLITFRHGSMMFILDRDTQQILWHAISGQIKDNLEGPHSAIMLPNGDIMLFDNGRYRQWSRVIELNPTTLRIVWEYRQNGFYSLSQGYVQALPNGNVLVTETEKGHVFEMTRDKEIVWEYYNPDKQDATNSVEKQKWGQRQEIYRMTRYPPTMIQKLLQETG